MKAGLIILGLSVSLNLSAQGVPVPHIFTTGNPIVASEFNANFQELSDRNDTTQTQITQSASDISTNQSSISTIQGNITQIQAEITNLQTNTSSQLLQFVGNSTGTVNGSQGIRAMTELCQADFVDSRVCTTEDYAKTTNFPASIPNTTYAWIIPSNVVGSGNGLNSGAPVNDIYSGQVGASIANFTCGGWRIIGGTGLRVSGTGQFWVSACNTPIPVSCCK